LIPLTLKGRAALFALLAVFLIPVGMSSLRGLTQIVTCAGQVEAPFTLQIADGATPVLVTSTRIEAGEHGGLCGGLVLDLRARGESPNDVTMILVVTNTTGAVWRGTVQLVIADISYPVPIGQIQSGASAHAEIRHHLRPGTYDLSGSLLVGP
jgi:hypothetical protein